MLELFTSQNLHSMLNVRRFLRRTEGRIFSVTFRKKDGTVRTMNCTVLSSPMMIKPTYTVLENNLLHRTGKPKDSIRSFRANSVIRMKCGDTYYINHAA
jgi:hypothetical protein